MPPNPVVEIRIPTYRRPAGLRRTIKSLQNQEEENWRALIFDGSPEQKAKGVIEAINDPRLELHDTEEPVNEVINTERAYTSDSATGAEFATAVRDYDTFPQDYLSTFITHAKKDEEDLLLAPTFYLPEDTDEESLNPETFEHWFKPKVYSPEEFQAHLFFDKGVGVGNLFWRTGSKLRLQVSKVKLAGLAELCRTLQINTSLRYLAETYAVTTQAPGDEPTDNTPAFTDPYARGRQSVTRYLIRKYGDSIIEKARKIADEKNLHAELESVLIDSGSYPRKPYTLPASRRLLQAFRSTFKFRWVNDPLLDYFRSVS